MAFDYDVFISFSSLDRAWADRVKTSLRQFYDGDRIFLDSTSLRAGDDWEAKLEQALLSTRNLVVLWSENAEKSQWVTKEYMTFHLKAKPEDDASRRMIFVNLQGEKEGFRRLQQLSPRVVQECYAQGHAAPQEAWDELIVDVRAGLSSSRQLRVPLVVLTLSQAELAALDAKRWKWIVEDFRVSRGRLLGRYGAGRADWQPFLAAPDTIGDVLRHTLLGLNKALTGRRAEWLQPGADFWDDTVAAQAFVKKEFNTSELSLLVIDPVAIYHPDLYQRLMMFQESFTRGNTVIATLPPFGLPRRITGLKNALQARGTPYFDDYFQPTVPPRRHLFAQCVLGVGDADDIRRHLLAAAGQFMVEAEASTRSTFLQQG